MRGSTFHGRNFASQFHHFILQVRLRGWGHERLGVCVRCVCERLGVCEGGGVRGWGCVRVGV